MHAFPLGNTSIPYRTRSRLSSIMRDGTRGNGGNEREKERRGGDVDANFLIESSLSFRVSLGRRFDDIILDACQRVHVPGKQYAAEMQIMAVRRMELDETRKTRPWSSRNNRASVDIIG